MQKRGSDRETEGESAKNSKVKLELNPDISLDISSLDAVKKLVVQNNAETKAKRRLRLHDFCNECLLTLSRDKDHVKDTLIFATEIITKLRFFPRSSTFSQILFNWCSRQLYKEAAELVQLLVLQDKQELERNHVFDESLVTVALRVLINAPDKVEEQLLQDVLSLLPREKYKRRIFTPLFEYALKSDRVDFAFSMLDLATASDIELWDADYNLLLQICTLNVKGPSLDSQKYILRVLKEMSMHHPVVGCANANLLKKELGGTIAEINVCGTCGHCLQQLKTFDLSLEERESLMDDIVVKLVTPRIRSKSHYEPGVAVSPEEESKRWASYKHFVERLSQIPYDTLIDGANLGYYGLNNWYPAAKEELLRSSGVDVSKVPYKQRSIPPLPVDVPPKFKLIETARKAAVASGHVPLIVLHSRHIDGATGSNLVLLEQWKSEDCVIASPSFLNDDYCWLYGSVAKAGTFIITNDQMRDHHFLLLSRRAFMCWRQRHRVTYKALYDKKYETIAVDLQFPRSYSVWTQQASDNLPTHWHIPFIENIDILDQATNRTQETNSDFDLNKNGDDECSAWLCTAKKN